MAKDALREELNGLERAMDRVTKMNLEHCYESLEGNSQALALSRTSAKALGMWDDELEKLYQDTNNNLARYNTILYGRMKAKKFKKYFEKKD